ncbi:MAG: hypothetical protein ABIJ45_11435 [Candidatus Zixiibacteriota bacterium]
MPKKTCILIILLCLNALTALGKDAEYPPLKPIDDSAEYRHFGNLLAFEPDWGVNSGTSNLIFANWALSSLQDNIVGIKWFNEDKVTGKLGGIFLRATKYALLDVPRSHYIAVVDHEYFGHGARYRELDIGNIDYGFDAPPPYGDGGGHATASIDGSTITDHELIAIMTGGVESQMDINSDLNMRWLATKRIDFQDAIFYLTNARIWYDYIKGTSNDLDDGKDMSEYIKLINGYAGYNDLDSLKMDLKYLKSKNHLNLINPFWAHSIYSIFKTYLYDGNETTSLKMIKFGGVEYLPSFKVTFTPFGLQYHFENYIRFLNRFALLNVKIGDSKFYSGWGGIGINCLNLIQHNSFSLDFNIDWWKQPGLEIGRENPSIEGDGSGMAIFARGNLDLNRAESPLYAILKLGYKTAGYLEGYSMDSSPIIMIGIGIRN